ANGGNTRCRAREGKNVCRTDNLSTGNQFADRKSWSARGLTAEKRNSPSADERITGFDFAHYEIGRCRSCPTNDARNWETGIVHCSTGEGRGSRRANNPASIGLFRIAFNQSLPGDQ